MTAEPLLLYILLAPLCGALINGLVGKRLPGHAADWLACGVMVAAFGMVITLLFSHDGTATHLLTSNWIPYGASAAQTVGVGLYLDNVTRLMLLLITGVGSLIHIYSMGYMAHDAGRARYFAYLNLFVFFMLLLVLSNNLLTLFVGWEGVGLCSYLLIGFWYQDPANAIAGKKAFIVNRVGDAGFILGMLILLSQFGTLDVHALNAGDLALADLVREPSCWLTMAALLLFVGAIGKSAQFPLMVWLPDAMAGPTPVSALIHAATMVTAGVYMIVRLNFVYVLAPTALEVIAAVGAFTAFIAACAALAQNDIKKVLAYSTVSQLGYMFLGLGVGAFSASMFHLITHGFFKALLFLSAGSVIHATHGEQDIHRMGGLKNYLIPTTLCFAAGSLALAGFPFLSGWFSKGAILSGVHAHGDHFYWALGVATAMLTAVYTVRLFARVFLGTPNMSRDQLGKLHESPTVMTLPMALLALLSLIGGWHLSGMGLGIPHWASAADVVVQAAHHDWVATLVESVLILGAIAFAWWRFAVVGGRTRAAATLRHWAEQAFFIDRLVTYILGTRGSMLLAGACRWVEVNLVEGVINFSVTTTRQLGWVSSVLQRSNVKAFMFMMLIGFIAIVWLVLWN